MGITNMIIIIVGIIVIIIGLAAFLNPNFARIINAPGGPKLKATIALVVGIIMILFGLFTSLPI
jgi:hypothetical protein